jgi:hypothetical protein
LTDREERYLNFIRDSILRMRRHKPPGLAAFLAASDDFGRRAQPPLG